MITSNLERYVRTDVIDDKLNGDEKKLSLSSKIIKVILYCDVKYIPKLNTGEKYFNYKFIDELKEYLNHYFARYGYMFEAQVSSVLSFNDFSFSSVPQLDIILKDYDGRRLFEWGFGYKF